MIKNEEGMPVLGWLVSWSTRGFSIERPALLKALADVGIDAKIVKEVLPKNAFIRALRPFAKGANKFHRKVADTDTTAAFVIAETKVNEKYETEFLTKTEGAFDKASHNIKVTGQKKKEIGEGFERNKGTYAGDQFRSIVLRYVKKYCNAVTYLPTGNLYLIPATNHTEFAKLQALFKSLKNVDLSFSEMIDTKQTRDMVGVLTVGEITSQIKKMKADLETLQEKGDDVKDSSLAVQMKKYHDLKTRVEIYELALQTKMTGLKTELEGLTTAAKKMLA